MDSGIDRSCAKHECPKEKLKQLSTETSKEKIYNKVILSNKKISGSNFSIWINYHIQTFSLVTIMEKNSPTEFKNSHHNN